MFNKLRSALQFFLSVPRFFCLVCDACAPFILLHHSLTVSSSFSPPPRAPLSQPLPFPSTPPPPPPPPPFVSDFFSTLVRMKRLISASIAVFFSLVSRESLFIQIHRCSPSYLLCFFLLICLVMMRCVFSRCVRDWWCGLYLAFFFPLLFLFIPFSLSILSGFF